MMKLAKPFRIIALCLVLGGVGARPAAAEAPQAVPQAKRVAWYLGTFDPVHLGHLDAANTALEGDAYDEVVLLPIPARGSKSPTSVVQRVAMLKLAIRDQRKLRVASWQEIHTVWTKGERTLMAQERLRRPGGAIARIIGADNIQTPDRIDYYAPEIPNVDEFLVMSRPGYTLGMALPTWMRVVETGQTEAVSSSAVRAAAQAGRPLPGLSPGVSKYIKRQQLYKTPSLQAPKKPAASPRRGGSRR